MTAPSSIPVHRRELGNGLRVVVSEQRLSPIVAVEVWYDVGSRHEEPTRTGFAHLFEHLMFQGSGHVSSGEHFSALLAEGASVNGTTSFDRTNYFETMPVHALELALWLEADRMGTLLDAVNQTNLDNQRDVVKNERRQRYDNQPYGTVWEQLFAALYPSGHPYHHLPIGSMEHLDAASLEDVHAFFRRFYGPDNALLAIVGDIDVEQAFDLADRHFGGIDRVGGDTSARDGKIGPRDEQVLDVLREQVPLEARYVGYRGPAEGTVEADAIDLGLDVLAGGGASRLVQRLVRGEQQAQSISAGMQGLVGGTNVAAVIAQVRSGGDLDRIAEVADEEIARLATDGPTADELERARARHERAWLSRLEAVLSRADVLCEFEALHGGADTIADVLPRVASITPDQVRAAMAEWLVPENRAIVEYRLDGAGR